MVSVGYRLDDKGDGMTQAVAAKGTTFKMNGNPIAEIKNIRGPNETVETIDVTPHAHRDEYQVILPGYVSGGQVAIEGNFIPGDEDGQVALRDALWDRSVNGYVITVPSEPKEATITFQGIVTAFEPDFPFDGVASFQAVISITGKPIMEVET